MHWLEKKLYLCSCKGHTGAGTLWGEKMVYDDPKDVFARIEALEAQFAAKQQEFKEKYL